MPFPLFNKIFSANTTVSSQIHPMVLLVLDGWGIAPPSGGNALTQSRLPNYQKILKEYPNTQLIASGESVGLPANEVGNSEVGHLTIGVGRVVLESLPRINKAIDDGSFYSNQALLQAVDHAKRNGSHLHLCGLIGSGNVHSSTAHLMALLDLCQRQEFHEVFLHLFTDGRDAPPQDGATVLEKIEHRLAELQFGQIASISGRYYAMDRDSRWDRTEKVYRAMTLGEGPTATIASQAVKDSYTQNLTDEFVVPTTIHPADQQPFTVQDKDAVIYFNFRVDRALQLTEVFVLQDFEQGIVQDQVFQYCGDDTKPEERTPTRTPTFQRPVVRQDICFVSMTEYKAGLPVTAVAFPKIDIQHPFSEVLAQHHLRQFHLAESEKERMVTYYFDGMRMECFEGEEVLIVPSAKKVGTYDRKPEMSLPEIIREFYKAISLDQYHFFIINFANPDMVAHSGNLAATIKACELVDWALNEMLGALLPRGGTLCITADHGNAEELLTYDQSGFFFTSAPGSMNTEHSNNPVPFVIINEAFKNNPSIHLKQGSLSDVAPTILHMMDLPVPEVMTGKNLLMSTLDNTSNLQ